MKIDLYTKVVLTIIAICLLALAGKDFVLPSYAQNTIDVNIVGADPSVFQYAGPLEVKISN